jgi:hypothetical protein
MEKECKTKRIIEKTPIIPVTSTLYHVDEPKRLITPYVRFGMMIENIYDTKLYSFY